MDIRIEGGRALVAGRLEDTSIHVDSDAGIITGIGKDATAERTIDAAGLLVLPGIVDIHGDAFERQMMPRPRVGFPLDVALIESDQQAIANGITTVFHGVTWSWEPGLRGSENARAILAGIEELRPARRRHALSPAARDLQSRGRARDHRMARGPQDRRHRLQRPHVGHHRDARHEHKFAPMVERSGLTRDEFLAVVERTKRRADEVPASIERLAAVANANGIPLLSHDDTSPEQRRWYRSLGCNLAEFPTTVETAEDAAAQGDDIVLGAPNVVRGGSHTGWIDATEMIERGLCSVLASDYYYPAPLLAAFALVSRGVLPLEQAWPLVSRTPAAAVQLTDRGEIAPDRRADLIIVDAPLGEQPRIVATIVAGRIVHLARADIIIASR